MGIKSDLQIKLDQLVNNSPEDMPGEIIVEGQVGQLSFTVEEVENLACSLTDIVYQGRRPFGQTPAELRRLGEAVANRINYLLEPLGNHELDEDRLTMQMRSIPPSGQRDNLSFYELLLRCSGEIRLHRYHQSPGAIRTKVPMELTRHVCGQLGNDLDQLAVELS